jgi:ABC-2 type transport system ATP-binding protein
MIEVEGLTKQYGNVLAVNNVSFRVDRGEILGFLGPNGAGKSTTMKILTCFMPANSGRATVAGFDVFTQSRRVREQVGYLPESVPLYTDMKVEEYLTYRARLKGVPRSERTGRVGLAMEKCQVVDRRNKVIGTLSKGYRQRVGLASTLVHNPPVLVLDEPTIGLDPNQIRQVRDLIKNLRGDHTVILSTHILPEVEVVCTRALIINRGQVAANVPLGENRDAMFADARLRIEARGEPESLSRAIAAVPGATVESVATEVDGVHRFAVRMTGDIREAVSAATMRAGGALRELRMEGNTLEDLFVKITTAEKEEPAHAESAAPAAA